MLEMLHLCLCGVHVEQCRGYLCGIKELSMQANFFAEGC